MILSDAAITELVRGDPPIIEGLASEDQIQPSSVDLILGSSFRVMSSHRFEFIDPLIAKGTEITEERIVGEGEYFMLHPGMFVLGTTMEAVCLPPDLVGRVDGKSSLGRIGLLTHATAGFIDPGFRGQITLELSNVGVLPIKLWPGMRIAQISFAQLDRPAVRPYGSVGLNSKYQDQVGATASRVAE